MSNHTQKWAGNLIMSLQGHPILGRMQVRDLGNHVEVLQSSGDLLTNFSSDFLEALDRKLGGKTGAFLKTALEKMAHDSESTVLRGRCFELLVRFDEKEALQWNIRVV